MRQSKAASNASASTVQAMGAFAVIFDAEANVLLCHRTDRDAWNLPGGKVEAGEAPWEAAVREVHEEIGLHVRVDRLLGVYSVPERREVVFSFLCTPIGGSLRPSNEADDIQGFGRRALPSNTLPRHLERIEDAYARREVACLKVQRV